MSALESYLTRLRESLLADEVDGEIHELSLLFGAAPDQLGISVCTTEGEVTTVGATHAFPMQSISKAFAYAAAIDRHGKDHVVELVDEEPTGEEFNAISIDRRTGRPKNPLVNVGAIRIHAMLGTSRSERTECLTQALEAAAGRRLRTHHETVEVERGAADRNLALAYMLRAVGSMADDAESVVAGYLHGCATLVTVEDLSVMAGTLANGGVNPRTGERAFSHLAARQALSVMMTCGMYDNAGDWVSDVGIPGKSGVSGGIIGALPTGFGAATYSPQLDLHGNSVRGMLAFERMSTDFALHLLDGTPVHDLQERAAELVG